MIRLEVDSGPSKAKRRRFTAVRKRRETTTAANSRGAPSVRRRQAPAEAVLAGCRLWFVRAPGRRGRRGAAGSFPPGRKPLESHYFMKSTKYCQSRPTPFQPPSNPLPTPFQTPSKPLPNPFQTLPRISGPGRRGGMAGRPSGGLGGASRIWPVAAPPGPSGTRRSSKGHGCKRPGTRARQASQSASQRGADAGLACAAPEPLLSPSTPAQRRSTGWTARACQPARSSSGVGWSSSGQPTQR
jgi:hypothetical protein